MGTGSHSAHRAGGSSIADEPGLFRLVDPGYDGPAIRPMSRARGV